MNNRKFELVADQSIEWMGRKLFRIRAKVAIESHGVKPGDAGGYVEKAENLDKGGNAWVSGDAQVFGDARVFGDAQVSGNARVSSGLIAMATRSDGYGFAIYPTEGGGYAIAAGCRFFTSFDIARAHWEYRKGTQLGAETDAILGYLEATAKARGYIPELQS